MSLTEHLAIAIDFSAPSEVALRAVFRLAERAQSARITVLHAAPGVVIPKAEQKVRHERVSALREQILASARQEVAGLVERFRPPTWRGQVEVEVLCGRPIEVIRPRLREIGATLFCLGTHARRGLERLLMGSVSEALLREIEIPTLVLAAGDDGVEPAEDLQALERVVVAVDLVEDADVVVDAASALLAAVRPQGGELVLVHAVELPSGIQDGELVGEFRALISESAAEQLARLEAQVAARGVAVRSVMQSGDVVDALFAEVRSISAQLIALGTHGAGFAPLASIGSTTAKCLRRADVVLLVVPSHPSRER